MYRGTQETAQVSVQEVMSLIVRLSLTGPVFGTQTEFKAGIGTAVRFIEGWTSIIHP